MLNGQTHSLRSLVVTMKSAFYASNLQYVVIKNRVIASEWNERRNPVNPLINRIFLEIRLDHLKMKFGIS
jgi:hypothetical protein